MLTVLSIFCASAPSAKGLLPMFSNQLVELVLVDDCDGFDDNTQQSLIFPTLQSLTLDDTGWLQYIDTPALKKLLVPYRYIENELKGAMYRFNHLQELQLCGGPS